jgi:hypothetical protein
MDSAGHEELGSSEKDTNTTELKASPAWRRNKDAVLNGQSGAQPTALNGYQNRESAAKTSKAKISK